MPSEKTNTLARAVRKDRHVGVQRITDAYTPSCRQKRQTRWRATNYGCCCAIAPSEKTNTKKPDRKRHTKGGGQNLVTQTMCLYCLMQVQCLSPQTPASVAMCFQKKVAPYLFDSPPRQTRWRATNYGCCCAIAPSEKTNAKKPDRKRQTKGGGRNLVTQTMCLYCLMQVQCLPPQTPASVAMCFQEKCCPVPFLQSTDTTKHRMQQRQQNKNKGFQY